MGEQRRWRRFPNPHFLLAGCFFFSPRCPFFFPLERKKWEGTTAAGCHAGGKKRGSWVGGEKTAAIAGPWGGGEGGAFRFRSHILPLDACASSAVYWCMIKTPPIFSSRERKKRGEREKRREEFCILLVSLLLLSFLSLSATNEKKGLGGPLKTQKKGEKEKNQCLLPTILSMYIIIKGKREREKTCSTSIERDCSSRESTGQSEEIRNRVCFVLFWWTWLTWSNGEFRPHGFFFDCQSRTHIRHKTVKKKLW